MERPPPLITAVLATGSIREWTDRLLGPDTPLWGVCVFILFATGFLALGILILAVIFRTFKGSWDLFRFLHRTRDVSLPCTNCGYDLRHKPDRCPECGQRVWFRDRRKTAPPVPPPSASQTLPLRSEPSAPDTPNSSGP